VANVICRKLPLGALLALRETCTTTLEWVDIDNRSIFTEKLKDIEIKLMAKNDLNRFLKQVPRLPLSNFDLQSIKSCTDYSHPSVLKFIQRFGPIIRNLTVPFFWKCVSEEEFNFYQGLKVLEQCVIKMVRLGSPLPTDEKSNRIPSFIRKLKLLDISSSEELFLGDDDPDVIPYCFQLFENARELETFAPCHVIYLDPSVKAKNKKRVGLYGRYFRQLLDAWESREHNNGGTIKAMNFHHINNSEFETYLRLREKPDLWLEFVQKILHSPSNIMLHHVSSETLQSLGEQLRRRLGERIVSLDPFQWSARDVEMPNLEVICMVDDDGDVTFRDPNENAHHPKWPKAKEINFGEIWDDPFVSFHQL
jgi:hypothetical protein